MIAQIEGQLLRPLPQGAADSPDEEHPRLLFVDIDERFRQEMAPVLQRRGFAVRQVNNTAEALRVAAILHPEFALVGLRLQDSNGLSLIANLRRIVPHIRVIMATRYPSISTAVEAIKLGAIHYLAKPTSPNEIIAAFHRVEGDPTVEPVDNIRTVDEVEWDHIQRVLAENKGNVSSSARALNMHRRSLQRKLARGPQPKKK